MANRAALLLALAAMSRAPAALADADGPDFFAVKGVAADDVLNLRASPSPHGEKIGEIPHDAHGLRNLGCEGLPSFAEWQAMTPHEREQSDRRYWCRVAYDGQEGWVAGRFLREDGAAVADEE
jgi:hypothetical protein